MPYSNLQTALDHWREVAAQLFMIDVLMNLDQAINGCKVCGGAVPQCTSQTPGLLRWGRSLIQVSCVALRGLLRQTVARTMAGAGCWNSAYTHERVLAVPMSSLRTTAGYASESFMASTRVNVFWTCRVPAPVIDIDSLYRGNTSSDRRSDYEGA
jgi:hypothetical protein